MPAPFARPPEPDTSDDPHQRLTQQHRHDRVRFGDTARCDHDRPDLQWNSDRRNLERSQWLDPGVSQRDQHHHQPGEHHSRRHRRHDPRNPGLTSNSGSLSLTNGASFSTAGDLSNTGSLTLGAGSTLTVNGNYTQGSSASLTIGIGGASSGNEYGQLNVTGSATLAGSVNASTASGFTPSAGDSFPIVTYASETGGSSLSFAGVNSGALSFLQPVVGPISIVLSTVTSPANLVVQPFSVAANATAGQNLTVTYQVDNQSGNAATGSWTDSVYLSTQTTLNSSSVLLGRVQQTGGVAANGQYSETLTAPVPGLAPDNYYVIVLADSHGLVPELNRTNTELASTNPVQVTLPALTLGSPVSGTIGNGQDVYYQLTLPPGKTSRSPPGWPRLKGASSTSATRPCRPPARMRRPRRRRRRRPSRSSSPTLRPARITSCSRAIRARPAASRSHFGADAAAPGHGRRAGPGGQLAGRPRLHPGASSLATTVSLVPHGGGSAIAATEVTFQGSTTLFAEFNLAGAAAGGYDLVVTNGGRTRPIPRRSP